MFEKILSKAKEHPEAVRNGIVVLGVGLGALIAGAISIIQINERAALLHITDFQEAAEQTSDSAE